jgi:hypothetical protein
VTIVGGVVLAVVAGVVGGVIGYAVATATFRRDQRFVVYAEYQAAFLVLAQAGSALEERYMVWGETMFGERRADATPYWQSWAEAKAAYERAAGRLRLVASRQVTAATAVMEQFIVENVGNAPPFRCDASPSKWGAFAQGGPASVDTEAVRLSHWFTEQAGREIVQRLPRVLHRRAS